MHRSIMSPGGTWVLVFEAVGDVCWCPEGHCGDVPVLHKLEGQDLRLKTCGEGVSSLSAALQGIE